MIIESDCKILWKNKDINIIFNPVSCCNNTRGRNRFNSLLKREFREVYNAWEEYLVGENPNKILSDVQLVKISDNKVILNAYCYNKKGDMDLLALTKTMVELFNLAEEYKLNIGIPYHLYLKNKFITTSIDLIISTIFSDCKSSVYYSKTHYCQRSN
nr:MAG TPA: O-acetyl-ADP-ribose deacetylase 1 [Herelleviridae sp.]